MNPQGEGSDTDPAQDMPSATHCEKTSLRKWRNQVIDGGGVKIWKRFW